MCSIDNSPHFRYNKQKYQQGVSMNSLFGNIKESNIISVFEAFLARKIQSRRNVADTTGLSFVTVSKVADALVELKILRQYNLTADSLSRRSRVLVTKQYYWIGVYTFSPDMFIFTAYDLSFKERYRFQRRPVYTDFPDHAINSFILRTRDFIKKNRIKIPRCIGLGVLVPGSYDKAKDKVTDSHINHFSAFRFKKLLSEYFPEEIIRVSSAYLCCANELRWEMNDDDKMFSFFIDKDSIKGAYITKQYVPEIKNSGLITTSTGKTLNVLANRPRDIDPFFNDISNIIFTLEHTIPLTKIAVGGNLYPRNDAVATVLHHVLSEKYHKAMRIPPDVISVDVYQKATQNITREIRTSWFKEKIIHQIPHNT